tara:strand:- start:59471 stop:60709 length:1239 start_codon:yes stop_codon:yes gene_type:complete
MAFTNSDGTPGSYGPNGTAIGQRTIGVIAAQGFTKAEYVAELQRVIDHNRFILPTSPTYIDPRSIPRGGNPSVEGVDSVKSHADDGENKVYNTPPTITIHGVEYPRFLPSSVPSPWNQSRPGHNFKFSAPKAGANSANNPDESSKKVRNTNYKTLSRQGKWNSTQGAFISVDSTGLSGYESGVMSNLYSDDNGTKDIAGDMGMGDEASYNPFAPMLISEGAQPTMFVASYAASSRYTACTYPPIYPNGGSAQSQSRGGVGIPGGLSEPRCTGLESYTWKAKRRITCAVTKRVPLALYLGWCARFQDTAGDGLCYIYGPQAWSPSQSRVDCYNPPAGNSTLKNGTWTYHATPIDRTGGTLQTSQSQAGRIAEREFDHQSTVALKCPDFDDAAYTAACIAVYDAGPPTFTLCVE